VQSLLWVLGCFEGVSWVTWKAYKGVPLIPKRSFLKQMRKKIEGDSRFSWTCPLANCTSAQNHEQVHIYVQKLSQTGFDHWINYYAGVSLAGISCLRRQHRLLLQPWQRCWSSSPIWTRRLCWIGSTGYSGLSSFGGSWAEIFTQALATLLWLVVM